MTIKDVEPVRVSFSEMHIALARGDIDAYVGAEPGPGVSLSTGVGTLVEYPYSTPMGSLNMVFGTHRDRDRREAGPGARDARHPPARHRLCREPQGRAGRDGLAASSGRRRKRSRRRCPMSN